MHIACSKDILYIGSIASLSSSYIGSLVQLHTESLGDIILCSKETCCDQHQLCRNLLLTAGNLNHIVTAGLLIQLTLQAYDGKAVQLAALVLVEFLHRCLVDSRICTEAGDSLFLAVIGL